MKAEFGREDHSLGGWSMCYDGCCNCFVRSSGRASFFVLLVWHVASALVSAANWFLVFSAGRTEAPHPPLSHSSIESLTWGFLTSHVLPFASKTCVLEPSNSDCSLGICIDREDGQRGISASFTSCSSSTSCASSSSSSSSFPSPPPSL